MVKRFVVDTNMWLMMDRDIASLTSKEEIKCVQACIAWFKVFLDSDSRLVVDDSYKILGEYRNKLKKGGLAEQRLNQLETKPRAQRLIEVSIEYDTHGYAILQSAAASFGDNSDKKFLAVALAADPPPPPIVNATDTDWRKEKVLLDKLNVRVEEVCPDYIEKHYRP